MSQNIDSVCIIDDDKIYVHLVSKIIKIKKLSDKILIFGNGKEALDFFLKAVTDPNINPIMIPKVIFLDLNMPIMDGWEFLQEFSKIKPKIAIHINLYVVSSSIDTRDINRAASIEIVSDYLTKPIELKDFERILDKK